MIKDNCSGIWVYAQQENGVLCPQVQELIAAALELKAKLDGVNTVTAIVLGRGGEALEESLFSYGAERVIIARASGLEDYSPRPYEKALCMLAEKYAPSVLLFPATPLGRELAPRLMYRLDTGLTADAIALDVNEDGVFVQTTPNFGGNILSHIAIPEKRPQMVTVHAGIFQALPPDLNAKGELIIEELDVEADPNYVLLDSQPKTVEGCDLRQAKLIVAGGRGIKQQEDMEFLRELAGLLGGELACSRPLVDQQWLSDDRQIGQTGASVKPEFILNVGISGSLQYLAGMDSADCIMTINTDKSAPLFKASDYGAVADYKKLLPALIDEIKRRKGIE